MKEVLWALIMLTVTAALIVVGWWISQPWLFLPSLFTAAVTAFSPVSWRKE